MEHLADLPPLVQILDAPVPQVVGSAMDFFRCLDLPVAEQVTDVPMVSSSSCSSRAGSPGTADGGTVGGRADPAQCRAAPQPSCFAGWFCWWRSTRFSFSLDRFRWASRSLTFQFLVVEGDTLVFMGFLPEQGTTASVAEQTADIPAGGGPHGFLPGQFSTSSPGPDHVDEHLPDSAEWVQFRASATCKPYYWNRRTNATAWKPPPGINVVWVGEREESGTGTRVPLPVHMTSLLCLLSEGHRGATSGCIVRCLRVAGDVQSGFFLVLIRFRIVRIAWLDSGYSSCVSLRWPLAAISYSTSSYT